MNADLLRDIRTVAGQFLQGEMNGEEFLDQITIAIEEAASTADADQAMYQLAVQLVKT